MLVQPSQAMALVIALVLHLLLAGAVDAHEEKPGMPAAPGMPDMPGMAAAPATPKMPGMAGAAPKMPGMAGAPAAPKMPATPAIKCAAIQAPTVENATVVKMVAVERRGVTVAQGFAETGGIPAPGAPKVLAPVDICDVNVTLTHGTANDSVLVEVWMPLAGWNGRFQGVGGGGFVPGFFGGGMSPQVSAGFAAASTDAGLSPMSFDGSGITFTDQLRTNFAFLSVHDMAVVGKAVVEQFYGQPAAFSYWSGCSTGGRQGYVEAQMFPNDFNGILAAAPAIRRDKFAPAEYWPFQVQTDAGEFVPPCVMTAMREANVRACDGLDGGMDGLIGDPSACQFDAATLVGSQVACNSSAQTVTAKQAAIYNRILSGPVSPDGKQLWFGVAPGTNFDILSGTTPFSLGLSWLKNFIGTPAQFAANNVLSAQTYTELFLRSSTDAFGQMLMAANPDLGPYKAAGHKLLSWHGLGDPIVMPQGTVDYHAQVQQRLGGLAAVDDFYRHFSAPGVGHCTGGGPVPNVTTGLKLLMDWVEKGVAPETLPAILTTPNAPTVTRNLCRLPFAARYSGSGDINAAESWTCERSKTLVGGAAQAQAQAAAQAATDDRAKANESNKPGDGEGAGDGAVRLGVAASVAGRAATRSAQWGGWALPVAVLSSALLAGLA